MLSQYSERYVTITIVLYYLKKKMTQTFCKNIRLSCFRAYVDTHTRTVTYICMKLDDGKGCRSHCLPLYTNFFCLRFSRSKVLCEMRAVFTFQFSY